MNMVSSYMKAEVSLKCYYISVNFKGTHLCWVNAFIKKPTPTSNEAVLIVTSFLCNETDFFHVQPFKLVILFNFCQK